VCVSALQNGAQLWECDVPGCGLIATELAQGQRNFTELQSNVGLLTSLFNGVSLERTVLYVQECPRGCGISPPGLTFNSSVLPTQKIYVFRVDLRTNSDYFPIQH
jgi:hypothetical protein